MTDGTTTWNYTYDANGMRTSRTNGAKTYNYVYNGSQLVQMTVGNDTLYFTYSVLGPSSVTWNGETYYYALNGQGDVTGIFDENGTLVVIYNWDNAWGYNPIPEGVMASTLGVLNPLRYRSYVYDTETGYYYLQSRYYDPEIGRFINADGLVATGQGFIGNNMFAYCNNNPLIYTDSTGCFPIGAAIEFLITWLTGNGGQQNYSAGSSIVKQLRKSEKMKSYINLAIDNYKSGQSTTTGSGEFTPGEDGYDLYLSTQHFDYTITVKEETRTIAFWWMEYKITGYKATVTVHDIYNFDTLRDWDNFGNTMNNLAYVYYLMGGGNNFEWYATFTYKTDWRVVA